MIPRPVFLLAALLTFGCSRPPPAVEYAGCSEVLRTGPTCLLEAGKGGAAPQLAIWLPVAAADISTEIRIDGRPVAAEVAPAREGRRYSIEVPLSAHTLEVVSETQKGPATWSLTLAPLPTPPEWFAEALHLARTGENDGARKILTDHLAAISDLSLRARVFWLLARIDPSPSENDFAGFRREIEARRKAGHLLGEVGAAAALAGFLAEDNRLAEASRVLDAVGPPPGSPAEVSYLLGYAHGLVARYSGEPRQALRTFEAAAAEADRLGLAANHAYVEQQMASLLLDLGRFKEADARFAANPGAPGAPKLDQECAAAQLDANLGWTRLLAREAGLDVGDPLPALEAARKAFDRLTGCGASHQRGNAQLNFALADLQAGRLDDAEAALKKARALATTLIAEERLWQSEIEARLALARKRPRKALKIWQDLEANARSSNSLEDLWLALTGRARTERALDEPDSALRTLGEAEDLLDHQAATAQRSSRARFVAQREASARLRIELLMEKGRTAEALSAARRSRARVLRQIETEGRIERLSGPERESWQKTVGAFRVARRACDQEAAEEWAAAADSLPLVSSARDSRCAEAEENLEAAVAKLGLSTEVGGAESFRPPGAGELLLAFHPLDEDWVAFAEDANGVTAHRFKLPPVVELSEDLSARLLTPFADKIRRAGRIRLLPYGVLRDVDLHALPFDRAPLLTGRPVVYGLDLVNRPTVEASTGTQSSALVISDPRGDLLLSRKEGERVRRVLADGGWHVERESGDDATVDRLLATLPRISLLHFAGHGVAGSADGGGELLLGGEERLLATEILNLDRAPAKIVLSGCETGRADPGAAVEGLGLAQAFLLRGASQVVAAIRTVPDEDAAALFEAFYRPPPKVSGDLDLAIRLARAQAAALRANPKSAAASFRVFEP